MHASAVAEPIVPRLIVGLGNPGDTYRATRHNIGFMVLEVVAQRLAATFQPEKQWKAKVARGDSALLALPQTYMNDSGSAVLALAKYHKLTPEQALVVYDDIDLPLGTLRFKMEGSAAGHNGIKSIISSLGTSIFPRLKVGIAPEGGRPHGDRMVGFVLGKFTDAEQATLAQVVDKAADAIIHALRHGLAAATNIFNRKP